ncbi:MAG: CSLREA domain-containing protein [Deltaproteobacteria bacterium]|nr:CSLREA domain-containing protein [Deltaproteobacteria bacterium]
MTKTADTNGTCAPGNCSLREAIEAANANPGVDGVSVPAGFYLLTLGHLVISDPAIIAGAGQTNTIVDGNATDRVFNIEATAGVVEISGITIQNGNADAQGGGIRNYAGLDLIDSTVSGNTASASGGGIYTFSDAGDLTLTNATVSGNTTAGSGGGIWHLSWSGDLRLNNSTVSGNTARTGAGIVGGAYRAGIVITNSTVSDNHNVENGYPSGSGAGLDTWSILTITNSTVSGNTSASIAGINHWGDRWEISSITNSTVSGNTAVDGFAGAIWGYYLWVDNTIVADNGISEPCSNYVRSTGYNLTDDDPCFFTAPTDIVVADAMLGPLQDNGGPTETHALLPGSPAIDAGSMDCPPPTTDQRGEIRPQGAACDIGAVEYLPEPTGASTLIAGACFLGLLRWRRARVLQLS